MKTILLWNLLISLVVGVAWSVYHGTRERGRVDDIHERLDELEHALNYRSLTLEEHDEWTALARELEELT